MNTNQMMDVFKPLLLKHRNNKEQNADNKQNKKRNDKMRNAGIQRKTQRINSKWYTRRRGKQNTIIVESEERQIGKHKQKAEERKRETGDIKELIQEQKQMQDIPLQKRTCLLYTSRCV